MSVLSDNYKRIISELETKITNSEDLEFVKEKKCCSNGAA